MDIAEGKKYIFVKYLDYLRVGIYSKILDSNNLLVKNLYKNSKTNKDDVPLWLFHGGELINLYSTENNRVPTKDIDLKLYLTGDYSIVPDILEKASTKMKPISLTQFDFSDTNDCEKKYNTITRGFRGILRSHTTPSGKNGWEIWSQGETQRNNLCADLTINQLKGTYSQIHLKTGKVRSGFELDNLLSARSQTWTNGDRCKAFIVNMPYVTHVGRDNIPYDINDKYLYKLGIEYDEEMDAYLIDEDHLVYLDEQFRVFDGMSSKQKRDYMTNKLQVLSVKHRKFKLASVIGVVLVYNETRAQWYLMQEGVLDTYIDYSAKFHSDTEKQYLGRYEDGSFPTTIQKVSYGKRKGIFKIPNLTWLISDQLRMLYATIRGEYLECSKKSCRWVTLGGGAAGNYEKYFKKLTGLLQSFNKVIESLRDGDLDSIQESLKTCREKNLEICGYQPFLTSLFRGFEFDLLKKRAQTKKAKTKRRGRSLKRRNKRKTKRNSLMHRLQQKNNMYENIF